MIIKRLYNPLEIIFWKITILLLSKSRIFQGLVKASFQAYEHFRYRLEPSKLIIWALSGWGVGFAIGFLGSFLLR